MRIYFFYFIFMLLFSDIDSFFMNRIRNKRLVYKDHLTELSKKKVDKSKKIKYTINHNKNNLKLEYNNITDYYFDNKYLNDKKIINIYPAGLRGFYEMGVCIYIKEKYNIDNYVFSGASAGSWNSLYLSNKNL